MAKHRYEFKKQLVSEYLDNQGSYASISQKHGMSSSCQLKRGLLLQNWGILG